MAITAALNRREFVQASSRSGLPADPRLSLLGGGDWSSPEAVRCWDALAARASEPNPFFESWYLIPSLAALDPRRRAGLLVLEQDGEWLGLMPLAREAKYYRYPFPQLRNWVHANMFLGAPLVARGAEHAFWQALLDWADDHAGTALFLHLTQMPLAGPLYQALQDVLSDQGRRTGVVHSEERAMLQSDLSPEAYLEISMSGKKRKELRRQHTRLSELGDVAFHRQADGAGLDAWIADFLRLESAGWKGKAGSALSSAPETEFLFRSALVGASAKGRLERLSITLDGTPIAMLANFITAPGSFSYKTAFAEDYARFSPGVLLQRENLALLSRTDVAWCDSCAAADHPMIDHIWRERRAIGRLSIAVGGTLRRAIFDRLLSAELGRRPAPAVNHVEPEE